MQPAIFLINLDRASERLARVQRQADRIGFTFERIRAVEGRNIPRWLEPEFSASKRLNDGEVGCYASHLVVASHIIGRSIDYAVVLEDDAEIDENFLSIIRSAVDNAGPQWDYIHLSSRFRKSVIKVAQFGEYALVRYTENPINATAYILSHRGARKWLAPMARTRPIDEDNRLAWHLGLKTYGVYPALVTPSKDLRSQISDVDGGRGRRAPKLRPDQLWLRLRSRIWTSSEIGLLNYAIGCSLNVVNSVRKRIDGVPRAAVVRASATKWHTNQELGCFRDFAS